MASITLKGNPINTIGDLPSEGTIAPDFTLTKTDLSQASLKDFAGKKIVLNIFPSVDTGICAASVRSFNEKLNSLDNTVVLCISKDLPFAHNRFCEAEGLKNVIPLSDFKSNDFGDAYQATIKDGPLAGLLSRAIVVVNEDGKIAYTEQVPEIVQEPDYEKAISALG